MTATHGLGSYGNAAGTVTPLDHKMAQLGLLVKTAANTIRAGLFWDGNATVVSGKANMSLDVRAFTGALSRGATAGAVLLANDAVLNLTKDVTGANLVAPGSNSVYWHVFVWQREFSIDGTDSNPVIGVLVGTTAPSPTVPALTAYPGALSLATVLVPAGVTATNSGTTITQTAPFTAVAGGVVVARTTTERDAYVPASTDLTARCFVIADGNTYAWNGSGWVGAVSRTRIIPTQTSSGGTVTVNPATGEVSASGAVTQLNVTIPNATQYRAFEITYYMRGSTSGTYALKLLSAGTPNATANSYRGSRLFDATAGALAPGTSWSTVVGSRAEHWRKVLVTQLAQAKITIWNEVGGSADAAANEGVVNVMARHTDPVVLDGIRWDLTTMGTLTDFSVTIDGLQ